MQHKLRLVFFSLILACGVSVVAGNSVYGQAATVIIDEIKNACGAQNNGSFRITVTSGTGPFSVFVFSPSTFYQITIPLSLGVPEVVGVPPPVADTGLPVDNNILVAVNDGDPATNFSTNISILSVTEITGITTTVADNSDNTCLAPNGSISINAISGGSGAIDFSWTGPGGFTATTQNITNLGGGDYVVTLTDQSSNCSFTSSVITITDPKPEAFSISSTDLTRCAGEDITVDLSFAEPGVEYRLYVDGAPTSTAITGPTPSIVHSGLASGSHTISVLATLGTCIPVLSSNTLAFDMSPAPSSAVLNGNAVVCEGASSNLSVIISGGAAPYSLTIDNGVGTINNYLSGTAIPVGPTTTTTYNFVGNVTDANGCTVVGSGSAVITVNTTPTAAISGGGVYCNGTTPPDVTFTFTGTAPFDFTYTDGVTPVAINDHNGTTYTITTAATGTYSVTALTDNNGCVATDLGSPVTVSESPLPTASVSGGGTVCSGSTLPDVTFTFTGAAPFDFTYTVDAIPVTVNGHNNPSYTITNAAAGAYAVTALTDGNGCNATTLGGSADVIELSLPTATIGGGGVYCNGTTPPDVTFTFTGTAPFDFTYTDGVTPVAINNHNGTTYTITTAATGTYSVTALTDTNGCVATDLGSPVTVSESPLPTASVSGGGTICSGSALPDVTFTFTGAAPFDFTYTVDAIPVTVNGHNNTSYTITNAAAGAYAVTALTDGNGCNATTLGGSADVIVHSLPTATIGGGGVYCNGTTLPDVTFTFTGTAPFDFTYTDGVTPVAITDHNGTTYTITTAATGTYSVTALTDTNGCVATDLGSPVTVSESPLPTASVSGGGTVCSGSALPDVTFTFTGAAPFDFTYTVDAIPVTVNGHNNTSYTITNAAAGTYAVTTLTDTNGCVATDLGSPVTVSESPLPTASVSGGGTVCSGSTLPDVTFTFTGAAPFDFTYTVDAIPVTVNGHNNTSYTITNAAAGTYAVTALRDANGCNATTLGGSADVIVLSLPTATIGGGGVYCNGTTPPDVTFTFTGTAPFDFTYTDGVTPVAITDHNSTTYTITTASTGTYSVAALTDTNGCVATDLGSPVTVSESPLPTASVSGGGTVCSGSTLPDVTFTFTGAAPFDFTYTVDAIPVTVNGHNNTSYTITNAAAGTYAVTALRDANGCNATTLGGSADVIVHSLPTATIGGGGVYCNGTTPPDVTFTFTGTAPFDFTYTDGVTPVAINNHNGTTYTITTAATGTYSVTALTDANGCVATDLGSPVAVGEGPIPGDQTTPGNETWIGYVYDDTGASGTLPGRIDFDNASYRGFIEATDIDNMSGVSTYDVSSDAFNLNLGLALGIQGPNVCGNLQNYFSLRYKMNKTFAAGVYRFTVGADDGVRLLIDGVNVIEDAAFDLHAYTTYNSDPVCLSAGLHSLEIQYFDNTAQSRLTFGFEEVPSLVTGSPLQVCINSPEPTLTVSSTDPDVAGFNWYKDGTLVFSGANYTPAASELNMTSAATTTFAVTAAYDCGETQPIDVIVEVLGTATLGINPQTLCESSGTVDLTSFIDGSPSGGTFTFSGHPAITGNNFDPSGLAGTTVSILVDYINGSCTAPQGTLDLTIINTASVNVPTATVTVCESSPGTDLRNLVSAFPAGGTFTFSGNGVTGNTFDPSGLSGIQTITVNYSIGSCVAPVTTVDLDVVTTASATATNGTACQNGGPLNLLTLMTATPPGGTFSFTGPGVSGNFFDPSGQSGIVNIDFVYDFNGCTDNGTIQITALDPADPSCMGGNCSTVKIVPKTEPATCTNSDGRLVMSLKPFIPAVNNTGVRISISGTSSTGLPISFTVHNDSIFENLPVGLYDYSVEYGDPSCIKTGQFSIDQSGTVGTPVVSNLVSPLCVGSATGSLTLNVPGEAGNILEWSLDGGLTDPFKPFTAGGQITGIPAGPAPSYQRVISVRRNISDVCYSSVTIVMPESVQDITAAFAVDPATCNGNDGAITNIVADGGNGAPYSYSIDLGQSFQPSAVFNGLTGGSYTLRVKDAAGCERDFTANVTFPGFINSVVSKSDADCSNGGSSGTISVTIMDSGAYEVALSTDPNQPAETEYRLYNNPPVTFPNLSRGQYYIYIRSSSGGCPTRSAPINIFGVYAITFDLQADCDRDELSLALVNVTGDANGAPMEIQVSKRLSSDPPAIIYKQFPANGEIYLDFEDYSFLQTPGEYRIKVIQFQSEVVCNFSSETFDFIVPERMVAQVGSVSESYPDIPTGKLQVTGFSGGAYPLDVRIELDSASSFALPYHVTDFEEVGLNPDQQLEMLYRNIPAGRYNVEVVDSLGCSIDLIARVPLDVDLFIPNVFTPNGDGSNDVFFIRNLPLAPSINQLVISNRWGKEVFVSENYQNNWDGEGAADGIYFYRLQFADNQSVTGWIEIMRGQKP